ncbi:hypothetical protein [Streptomyces sp. YGL11-2]|uniref:hypothetical protein n=1 Tax=Streptomyces sp. YGL11-2 TaxID=3414028 RepID=UPI003CF21664
MPVLPVIRTIRYATPCVVPAVRACSRFFSEAVQVLGAPALARPAVGHTTLKRLRARRHAASDSQGRNRPEATRHPEP